MTVRGEDSTAGLSYATTDPQAENRYEQYRVEDPFPDIPPGLLRSTDIKRYVATTGMIHPFHPELDAGHMKQASYAVKVLGRCIYWDEKDKKHDEVIEDKKEFVLKRNSIAFISLEPRFRIPYYIALRFNLKIRHIHRGILLGTGPLVDPGFDGKLLVPLHNLTMNDYVIRGGDDLIWFEFTKLVPAKIENIAQFRSDKNFVDPDDYLHKAYNGHPIASSLSEIRQFSKQALRATRIIKYGGAIALVGLLAAIIYPTWTLFSDSVNYVKGAKDSYAVMGSAQALRIQSLEKEVESLRSKIQMLEQRTAKKDTRLKAPESPPKTAHDPGK
jgi:deoxycytidine triphosphate deaminase